MALDKDGDVEYVQGSGSKPYTLKNVSGVLSCSCPAWRNQGISIEKRTCKHLKKLRGTAAEEARVSGTVAPVQSSPKMITTPDPDQPKVATGCSCEVGSTCNVSHDPATCPCAQCVTAEEESRLGRKLRPDEKTKLFGPPVLLAHAYDASQVNPTGWWWSEKLDGVRALWDGEKFITRQGNIYYAPDWFRQGLPKHSLDGELWMGRRMFQKTISVVKSGPSDRWRDVTFMVFDAPHLKDQSFEKRMEYLENWHKTQGNGYTKIVGQTYVQSAESLQKELERVVSLGGEGLMIRKPGSLYVAGRSDTLLKVKMWKDAEGIIVALHEGKKSGRHAGRLGSIEVRMPSGQTFKIGSGLEDSERNNPPKIGDKITYRYCDTTDDGIPKGANFVCVRDYE